MFLKNLLVVDQRRVPVPIWDRAISPQAYHRVCHDFWRAFIHKCQVQPDVARTTLTYCEGFLNKLKQGAQVKACISEPMHIIKLEALDNLAMGSRYHDPCALGRGHKSGLQRAEVGIWLVDSYFSDGGGMNVTV